MAVQGYRDGEHRSALRAGSLLAFGGNRTGNSGFFREQQTTVAWAERSSKLLSEESRRRHRASTGRPAAGGFSAVIEPLDPLKLRFSGPSWSMSRTITHELDEGRRF